MGCEALAAIVWLAKVRSAARNQDIDDSSPGKIRDLQDSKGCQARDSSPDSHDSSHLVVRVGEHVPPVPHTKHALIDEFSFDLKVVESSIQQITTPKNSAVVPHEI